MTRLKWNKYAVTGAAGFIGSHIVEELLERGKHVVIIDNMVAGKRENLSFLNKYKKWEFWNEDVSDLDRMIECLHGVDVVFHLAASKCTVCREDPHKDLMVNAMGSYNVFRASELNGVKKVIHASTGSVLGGKPKSFYGVSKLAGETYLRAFKDYNPDFNFTAIRYHHVFGPRQEWNEYGGVIPIFITNILADEPITIFGDGTQVRYFTYVDDLVNFNLKCESEFDGEFVNFANNMPTTLNELADQLMEIMGKKVYTVYGDPKPGDIYKFNIEDNKYPSDLRASWCHQKRSLKKTVEYYKEVVRYIDSWTPQDTKQ